LFFKLLESHKPAVFYFFFAHIERGPHCAKAHRIPLRKIDQMFPTRANDASGSVNIKSGHIDKEDLIKCPLHGWCAQKPADCSRAVANGGDGAKSPHFRQNE
jgi:hypothetical protein